MAKHEREARGPGLPERLAGFQYRRPWLIIGVAFALGLAALPLIVGVPGLTDGLTLNSDFTAMLPESAQSVRDLDEIQERFGGQQAMIARHQGRGHRGAASFHARLRGRVSRALERATRSTGVDWNLSDFTSFVEAHRHLYADLDELESIRDALQERLDYERARANPFYIDLGDEEPPDPAAVVSRIEHDAEEARQDAERRFPDGFLQHPNESVVLIVVHTRISGGDAEQTDRRSSGRCSTRSTSCTPIATRPTCTSTAAGR